MSTPQTVKAQIQSLIDQSNATTGKTDTDLTSAVGSLVSGYGQGGDSDDYSFLEYGVGNLDLSFERRECPKDFVVDFKDFLPYSLQNMFYRSTGVETIKLICKEQSKAITYISFCSMCTSVKVVDLTEFNRKIAYAGDSFATATSLESILGSLDFTECTSTLNTTFNGCSNLIDVEIVEKSISKSTKFDNCPNLSDASIQSIIDGLADLTGQTAQIITFHPDVKAKLTDEQKAQITNKNWTLA